MDVTYQSFLSSPPFSITGPDGAVFYAHGDLLAQASNVLAVEVSGTMREAQTRAIRIEDVDNDLDDETVMRFLEFAYRGDYTVPPPDIVISSNDVGHISKPSETKSSGSNNNKSAPINCDSTIPLFVRDSRDIEADAEVNDIDWGFQSSKLKKGKKKKCRNNLWCDFHEEEYEIEKAVPCEADLRRSKRDQLWSKFCDQALARQGATWEPKLNTDSYEDHSCVYASHPRLYVFSNRYECDALRDLCLQKLRLTLSRHELHQSRRSDITKLVRYSYEHTPNFHEGSDKLRSLVSDYVVCHIEQMCHEQEFLDLLQVCDGLATDLMVKLMQRLE